MKKRAHCIVSGKVQGVCYRIYACEEARRLGLTGWVRNLRDSRVEIVAEGEESGLDVFLDWCRKGPSYADVADVDVDYRDVSDEFGDFRITY